MKLISTTDFVLEKSKSINHPRTINVIIDYANFLKQPLELWMFVPCDKGGNVLEEPKGYNYFMQDDENGCYEGDDESKCREYQQAKERCLFDGWNPIAKIDITICIENELKHRLFFPNCMDIENIVYTNTQLTKTAEKLIGL